MMLRDRIADWVLRIAWPILWGAVGLIVLLVLSKAFAAGYGLYLLAGSVVALQLANFVRISEFREETTKVAERLRILTRRLDILDADLFNTKERLLPIVSHPWFRQQERVTTEANTRHIKGEP